MSRTPQEILDQTNRLAREFYKIRGYVVPEGYNFQKATHPQEREAWTMAAIAQYELTETDLDDVLAEMNEGVGLISGWAQEKDDEERLSTRQVHTSLLLIDGWEHVEEHHLLAFSKDELTQIFEWATAEHLYASDNSVERRSRPACLIHLSPHRIQLIRNRTEGV